MPDASGRSTVVRGHPERSALLQRALGLLTRALAAVVGGYAASALAVAGAAAGLSRLGMARAEAVVLCAMLGFVFYLALVLWAFATRSLVRVTLTLGSPVPLWWLWMGT